MTRVRYEDLNYLDKSRCYPARSWRRWWLEMMSFMFDSRFGWKD